MAHRVVQLPGDAAARLGLVALAGNPLAHGTLLLELPSRTAPGPQSAGHERRHDHGQDPLEVHEGEVLASREVNGGPERGEDGENRCRRPEVVSSCDHAVHQHQKRDPRVGALIDRGRHRSAGACRERRGEGTALPEEDTREDCGDARHEKPHGCGIVIGGQEGDVPCEEDRLQDHAGGRCDERQLPRIIPPPDSAGNGESHRLTRIPHGCHLLLFIFPYLPQDDEVAPLSGGTTRQRRRISWQLATSRGGSPAPVREWPPRRPPPSF